MGCSASMPDASKFLAGPQPAPPGGYLLDGVPEAVVMQAWSNFQPTGDVYHVDGGVLGAVNMLGAVRSKNRMKRDTLIQTLSGHG